MSKARVKQPHYIPRKSYLEYFTDKSRKKPILWAFMDKQAFIKDIDGCKPKTITPLNFCKEHHMYEAPGLPINALEKLLASIEQNYKRALEDKILKRQKLSEKDRQAVTDFISTLEMRTPAARDNIHNFLDKALKQVKSLEQQYMKGKKSNLHRQLVQLKEQNLAFTRSILTSWLVNRWGFSDFVFLFVQFEGEDQFFVTSDFPVCLVDFTLMNSFYGVPPSSPTLELTIPLTPKVALLGNNIGVNGYRDIDFNFVREINNRTIMRSNNYVISPQKLDSKFLDRCLNRFRQSFLLLFLQDSLGKKLKKVITKEDVLYWVDRYNKEEDVLDKTGESELRKKFQKNQYMTKIDLVRIVKWKFHHRLKGRQKAILNRLKDKNSSIIEVSKKAFKEKDDGKRVKLLSSIKGVGNALSSVILAFYDPKNYGVLDIHAWREIFREREPPDVFSNPKQAVRFFMKLRVLSKATGLPCREIEKGMFKKNLDESRERKFG